MPTHRSAATGLLAAALLALAALTACGSDSKSSTAAPTGTTPSATVTVTATPTPSPTPPPTPTVTVTRQPTPTVTVTPAPPTTVTARPPATVTRAAPQFTNAAAVVQQYYQDITDHNYAAAWALGGANIAGSSYSQYVAGFATTAAVSLGTVSEFDSSTVRAVLYATQTDGSVKVFQGTYTVTNGVLTAADIHQIG
ncbi:hypothetical protein ACFW1A_15670 [Kitasatospora sp. NPDC058965]|uniref:hypothetical protein n=1 Tax=Kitasatospora sp. NPDC058965 TaxID=3346682 RepID=UPI0036964E5B